MSGGIGEVETRNYELRTFPNKVQRDHGDCRDDNTCLDDVGEIESHVTARRKSHVTDSVLRIAATNAMRRQPLRFRRISTAAQTHNMMRRAMPI
jgi:hypothetical protein